MPPSLPETRSVGEELLDLKDDLVVDEAEEDGDNHPLRRREEEVHVTQGKQQLVSIRLRYLGVRVRYGGGLCGAIRSQIITKLVTSPS